MSQPLNQVHFRFNSCPEFPLQIDPPLGYIYLYGDDFASVVRAGIHINNLVHFTLSSAPKGSKLLVLDLIVIIRLEWGPEQSIIRVNGDR